MKLTTILGFAVAVAGSAVAAVATPPDNLPLVQPITKTTYNASDLTAPPAPNTLPSIWMCENTGWGIPCDNLVLNQGTESCYLIAPGSVASRAKSVILPHADRFPEWECRFFKSSDCRNLPSCYLADMRPDMGCRETWGSFWCIDDL